MAAQKTHEKISKENLEQKHEKNPLFGIKKNPNIKRFSRTHNQFFSNNSFVENIVNLQEKWVKLKTTRVLNLHPLKLSERKTFRERRREGKLRVESCVLCS